MKKLYSFAAVFALILSAVGLNFAQQSSTRPISDKYVISAIAGAVNYVEGTVGVVRRNGQASRLLKGDLVKIGDRVSTSADGKAEILLNPGSYLRLGGSSAFEFLTTTLDDLRLKIDRGQAILEVFAANEFAVTLMSPNSKFKLVRSGIYRLDVSDSGSATLSVKEGRAEVGGKAEAIVKSGKSATVSGQSVAIVKLSKDQPSVLDDWSKSRAKQLAKMTNSFKRNEMRDALLNGFAGRRWNTFDSFGLWVYDRFAGTFGFLPFGYGWYSPYGYGFDHYLGMYDLPAVVYRPPTTNIPTGSAPPPNTRILSAGDRSPVPPFIRMQSTPGGRGIDQGGVFDGEVGPPLRRGRPVAFPDSAPTAPPKVDLPQPPITTKDGD